MKLFIPLDYRISGTHKCAVGQECSKGFEDDLPKKINLFGRVSSVLKRNILISECNPQTAEYFRSQNQIMQIKKQHLESKSIVIHPFSMFRAYYEMWMAVALIVALLYLPMEMVLDLQAASSTHNHTHDFQVKSLLVRLPGMADIFMTFITGYSMRSHFTVEMMPWKIARKYVLSLTFLSDFLTAVPAGCFTYANNVELPVVSLSFLKIIRLPTLSQYITRSGKFLNLRNVTVEIIRNGVIICVVFHWFTCLHFVVPQIRFLIDGEVLTASRLLSSDILKNDLWSLYVEWLYRTTGYIFCVNFEQARLGVWEETVLAIVTMLVGKVLVLYITISMLHKLLSSNMLEVKYFEVISEVKAFMNRKRFSVLMQERLLKYYDYKYNRKFFKERRIAGVLSDKLKAEINLSVCRRLVQSVALLAHLPQQNLEQVIAYLKPEVYLPGDMIIKAGSVGDCMYFLASGTVAVWTPSGKEVCHLQDGAYFGEISLIFKDKRRTANIVALEISEVYKLDRRGLKSSFKTNSRLYRVFEAVAKERLEMTQMFESVHAKHSDMNK